MEIKKYLLAEATKFETPYYIINGSSKGKTVMITAGVHGKEIASILSAKRLVALLKKNKLRIEFGTLIIVPVVNRKAFKRRIRGIPDLNRTFPRKWKDKARHPLSAALFRLAKKYRPSWYIDLHEANGLSKINPRVLGQTLIAHPKSKAIPAIKRIADHLNRSIVQKSRHFTMRLRTLPAGSGRHAAFHLLKAKAVTVETCWSMPMSTRINFQMKILEKLLAEANLI
ncbi:succinylglutamate desuccinylase/aspartoacylase family protein [Paenibacillus radicis (ex Xue et al. 2023)]|uniref:Succinylglutamate desuccinylase/aspartoacylase family protein n=1 Tax=Paenibacillus radicis (ex Xue et al. 2023) TaxID=2972489 RepID=A0ABT1YDV2_9BACL|nr:succinylglutamate desuccinylase/aspartoacylase family protein [Paenibacillus radicis (ex Xue et al. 2023)]MCR8630150.1 succinylglutamate desuccinylase/aspartoacylase family protein [Paenibacillus radicis (ex Xue et al. 2023)]